MSDLIGSERSHEISNWFDDGVNRPNARYLMVVIDDIDFDLKPIYTEDEKELAIMFKLYDEPHAPVQEIFDLKKSKEHQFSCYPCWEAPSRKELYYDPDAPTAMDWLVKQLYYCVIMALFFLCVIIAVFITLGIGWVGIKIWPITIALFLMVLFRLIYLDHKKGWKNLKETIKGDF